jgi:hypothetical protein
MPIEIRELVIRAQVEPNGNGAASQAAKADPMAGRRQEDIIRACVEEVLRVLAEKQER